MILCLSDLWLPFPGGAERLMFNLARHLMRRGQHVRVLTGYEAAKAYDGPRVRHAPIGSGPDHDAGWGLIRAYIDMWQPRLILTHHHYANEFMAELAATGLPIVQVVLNGTRHPEAALAVYISEWVRDQVGGAQPNDLVMTPPAFDDVVADHHGDAIGFVKPLPHKGAELVYRIAQRLPRRRFVILRGEWQTLEVIHPAANIEFLEPVDDMRDFYSRCRLVLMPSLHEDAGTVAQEAARNGLPCISSAEGGLAETNAGGVQLDPTNVSQWVGAIKALDDPAAYERVVANQREHLERTNHDASLALFAERVGALG